MDEVHRKTSLQNKRHRRKALQHSCQVCRRVFYGWKDITGKHGSKRRQIAKYCSKACWSIRATIINKCGTCGRDIKTSKSLNKKYCNLDCRNKRYKLLVGEDATAWRGDNASYSAKHKWMTAKYGKPTICEKCRSTDFVDWANVSGTYKRDRSDWLHLCRKCHFYYDKRNEVFKRYR